MRVPGLLLAVAAVLSPSGSAAQSPPRGAADDFVSAAPAPAVPEPLAAALAGIEAEALAAHVAFLASPALEGRGLGSRGLDAAAEYAAAALALAGVPPLAAPEAARGSAGYFHPVPLRQVVDWSGEVAIETERGGAVQAFSFASGAECLLSRSAPRVLTAPVVFAGFGIREEKPGHDDYAGLDVRGKVVLVLRGTPDGEAWREPGLAGRYDSEDPDDRWDAKLEAARAAGAAAVLAVEGGDFAKAAAGETPTASFFLPFDAPGAGPLLARLSPDASRIVLGSAGLDAASARTARPRELPGVTATLRANGTVRLASSRNVIGVLTGSDPKLRDEAVVIGAHVDHLGMEGGVLHPGADDNASGVSALVEIARAFAAMPGRPKRTVVFAFWTGEEDGKFGSGHWVRHPAWPLARTVAYVNLDMIGHPWLPEELRKLVADAKLPDGETFLAAVKPAQFAEPGLPPDAPEIEAALRWAGPATGMALHLDRTDGTRGGSDYRDFARARVPFIRFFGNFFPAYHEKGDTAESLDATQVQRMARLALATAWRLAEP
jgi:hypothetical protein